MTTYYVAQSNGSNGNSGGSSDPWRTIAYAISQVTTADTIIVRGGTYAEQINVDVANLTIQTYGGEDVWIDGGWAGTMTNPSSPTTCKWTAPDPLGKYATYDVSGEWDAQINVLAAGVTLDGINVRNTPARCVVAQAAGCTLKNAVWKNAYGSAIVLIDAPGATIEDVKISYVSLKLLYVGTSWPHIIGPRSQGATWRRVEIYDSFGEGFSSYTGEGSEFYDCKIVDCNAPENYINWSPGTIIAGCEIYFTDTYTKTSGAGGEALTFGDETQVDCVWNASLGRLVLRTPPKDNFGRSRDVQIYNNLFVGFGRGLAFGGDLPAGKTYGRPANAIDVLVAHNTFIQRAGAISGDFALYLADMSYTANTIPPRVQSNIRIENNIFQGATISTASANRSAFVIRNNYFSSAPASWMTTGGNTGNITSGSAGLVSTTAPSSRVPGAITGHDDSDPTDYQLTAGSQLRSAGIANEISTDFWGNLRDDTPDIGAHEYGGAEPDPGVTLTAAFTLSANRVEENTAVTLTDASTISAGAIDAWAWEYKLTSAASWTSHSTSATPADLTIATAGEYQIRLTVTDTESSQSAAYTLILTVTAADADAPGTCTGNTLTNGDFAGGTTGWSYNSGGGSGSWSAAAGYADVTVTVAAGNLQLYQTGITITEGQQYRLAFRAKGDQTRVLRFFLFDNTTIRDLGIAGVDFDITTNWLAYEYIFTAVSSSSANARLQIRPGLTTGGVQIDDLCLAPYTAPTAPEAIIDVPSNPATVGVEQTLDGSSSTGTPTAYSWEIDGVEVGTASTYAWTPTSPRSYTIALTVANAYGSDTSTIAVAANVAGAGGTVAALLTGAVPGSTGSDGGTDHAAVGTTGGVITLISNATTAGTAADGARIGAGFSDGTNEYAVALASEHNAATTNTDSRTEAAALYLMDNSSVLADGDVALTDADTTTISWNTVTAGKLYAALRIAATNAAAGTFIPGGTAVNVGFQPDVIFVLSSKPGNSAFDGTAGAIAQFSLGWKTADGERSLAWYSDNASAAGRTFARMSNTYSGMTLDTSGGALSNGVNLTITATGFSHTNTGSMADSIAYLALKLDGLSTQIIDFDTPTSTGLDSLSANFEAGAAISIGSLVVAFDSVESDDDASVAAVGLWDSAGSRAVAVADDDGADPTVTKSLVDNVFLLIPAANGSANINADVDSVSASTFVLDYTLADATARKVSILLIEQAAGAGAIYDPLAPGLRSGLRTGMN